MFERIVEMQKEVEAMPLVIRKEKDPLYMEGERVSEKIGLQKGQRLLLKKILLGRFGEIDEDTERLIDNATSEAIERCSLRIFDLESLEDVKKVLKE